MATTLVYIGSPGEDASESDLTDFDDLDNERELVLDWRDPSPSRVLVCETLTGPELKAANTFEKPTLVAPKKLDAPKVGTRMTFKLPAASYTVAQMARA